MKYRVRCLYHSAYKVFEQFLRQRVNLQICKQPLPLHFWQFDEHLFYQGPHKSDDIQRFILSVRSMEIAQQTWISAQSGAKNLGIIAQMPSNTSPSKLLKNHCQARTIFWRETDKMLKEYGLDPNNSVYHPTPGITEGIESYLKI